MSIASSDREDLRLVLGAALRSKTALADPERLRQALIRIRRFSMFRDISAAERDMDAALRAVRARLRARLPKDRAQLAEKLGLEVAQSSALLGVLSGLSIGGAHRETQAQHAARSTVTRWMKKAADRLEIWVCAEDESELPLLEDATVRTYIERLRHHCTELPTWFPEGSKFMEIIQEVAVRPPSVEADERAGEDVVPRGEVPPGPAREERSPGALRRLPWATALQQFRRVLLIGDPGSGKSWAIRARALELADAWSSSTQAMSPFPVLVLAPKLEELLNADAPPVGARSELAQVLASSMPDDIAIDEHTVALVQDFLEKGAPVELLIDGYDEIHTERPQLARRLGEIVELLDRETSHFALTTRPATVPQHRFARIAAACELQPFGEREQLQFIDAWFAGDEKRSQRVRRWVVERRLDLLRTPLMIALFCAVAGIAEDALPQTEPELWHRALSRLASEEDRYDEVSEASEVVRMRLALLEEISGVFVTTTGLLDSVPIRKLEEAFGAAPLWTQIQTTTRRGMVIDDLTSTGIIRKITGIREQEIEFLHSAIRDYLLARLVARRWTWPEHIWRVWSQPEWEPVIGYLGTLLEDPDEVLLALETQFHDDPLNASRLTAGRALSVAGVSVSRPRYQRVRDELLVLLASHDAIDRSRSASLLASLQDPETEALVRKLINPAIPTRVVVSALRTIASGTSRESINVLSACARSPEFTDGEHEAAIEALADIGSPEALESLNELSGDQAVDPVVRAGAAFSALRLFGETEPALTLVQSSDEESQGARWMLAERLAAQAETVGTFITDLQSGEVELRDSYCRALFVAGAESADRAMDDLVPALPSNPAVDLLVEAVEAARALATKDPLVVTVARYILAEERRADTRWTVARRLLETAETRASAIWNSIASRLGPRDNLDIGEFLAAEVSDLPADLARLLNAGLHAGDFGPVAAIAARSLEVSEDERAAISEPTAVKQQPPEAPQLDIEAILTDNLNSEAKYQLLRVVRRTIPAGGDTRELAASLTHLVSVGDATEWIDAQPTVAPLVEARLAATSAREAMIELARLRAHWPGRHDEVADTATAFDARVLDARAEAALISDNLDEAATMALASIGARQGEDRPPTGLSVTLLFAAGAATGRTANTLSQVSRYLNALPGTSADRLWLYAWLQAALMRFDEVAEALDLLPPHLESDANFAGLQMAAGISGEEAFNRVISWSGCKRASVLISAVGMFTDSASVLQRLDAARNAADLRAANIATTWPSVGLNTPSEQGTPKWTEVLVGIAAQQLEEGRAESAVAVYAAAVNQSPNNPALVNNLGFCQIPVDADAAEATLERAANLYTRPFGVNVANRMLVHIMRGAPDRALELGEAYYQLGPTERGLAWLWDIDDPSVLQHDVDILDYIIQLGRKAALQMGRLDIHEVWDRRLVLRRVAETQQEVRDDGG